ncbi:hypothetical protein HJC23_011657 [Cyclotella cryptica]|uniref:Bromodomain associated domain-containing protein n=1 Tax=Cyclotella cryptica TaxID=29204 RepID=A0ABD3NSS1_9STRA|eukprot:CCRYP_020104-RB/>CCRYP_020104-RB protein AED:0.12 eAED:0.12 QI:137/1/1/1/0.5/0.33/3/167/609
MTTDNLYTTSLAHRSIARAALHLGIEGMETKALEALGGVLVDYLERIGATISNAVELSGRSSAHVNVYDALNAIEACTFPAAEHLAASFTTSVNASSIGNDHGRNGVSIEPSHRSNFGEWESLASFLFGPEWYLIPLEGEDPLDAASLRVSGSANKPAPFDTNGGTSKTPGGKSMLALMSSANAANAVVVPPTTATGKQLPILAASTSTNTTGSTEKNVSFTFDRHGSIGSGKGNDDIRKSTSSSIGGSGRWHAPFLDTVEPFPIVSSSRKERISNPHRLGAISKSLHDLASEREACRDTTALPTLKRKTSEGTAESTNTGSKKNKVTKKDGVRETAQIAEDAAMREALRLSDDVCLRKSSFYWGGISDETTVSSKISSCDAKSTNATEGDKKFGNVSASETKSSGIASTKVKFSTSASNPPANAQNHPNATRELNVPSSSNARRKPSYVPNFLPHFPPTQEIMEHDRELSLSASNVMGKILSNVLGTRDKKKLAIRPQEKTVLDNKKERDEVRQYVIELGKSSSYWGSGWLDCDENTSSQSDIGKTCYSSIAVAGGSIPGSDGMTTNANDMKETTGATAKKGNTDMQVLPLGRASSSRISKILEGSMN